MGKEPDVSAPVEEEVLDEPAFKSDLSADHQEEQHRHEGNPIDEEARHPEYEDVAHADAARIVATRVRAIELWVCAKLEPWVDEVEEEIEHHIAVACHTDELSCTNLDKWLLHFNICSLLIINFA